MSKAPVTDFSGLLLELNGGVYSQMIDRAISDIAANVCTHGGEGEMVLKLKVKRIGQGNQVHMTHSLKASTPKATGKDISERTSETPLHVGPGGVLTLFPNAQTKLELGAGAATGAAPIRSNQND